MTTKKKVAKKKVTKRKTVGRRTREEVHMDTKVLVKRLAALGLSLTEIAQSIGHCKVQMKRLFQKEWEEGNFEVIKKLRTVQLKKAINDENIQMLIHLGKHFLNQRDSMNVTKIEPEKDLLEDVETADLLTIVKDNA